MNEKNFSMSEALKFGWKTFEENVGFFIFLIIVLGGTYISLGYLQSFFEKDGGMLGFMVWLASVIIQMIIGMGLIKISLKFCDKQKARFEDLLEPINLFIPYLLGSILYALIVMGGMILLIIPGIIWAVKFGLFSYGIIDRKLDSIESLKFSSKVTQGVKWNLFLFWLLCALINFAGALMLGVGLFITAPVTMIAYAYVYRKLAAQTPEFNGPEVQNAAN